MNEAECECWACDGHGYDADDNECYHCGGDGWFYDDGPLIGKQPGYEEVCANCGQSIRLSDERDMYGSGRFVWKNSQDGWVCQSGDEHTPDTEARDEQAAIASIKEAMKA